jgi:ankyrin repeat protein
MRCFIAGAITLIFLSVFIPVSVFSMDPDMNAEVIRAVKRGDIQAVSSLLDNGGNVSAAQNDGTSAIAWAVYHNNDDLVDLLVNYGDGADINAPNEYGVNPLHLACMNQDAEMVSKLLRAGADPNNAKWTGETPLMTCANTGTLAAVRALLDNGADVNAVESTQLQTALMWAAAEKYSEVVALLIERGANIHAVSKLIPEAEPFHVETPGSMGMNFAHTLRFRKYTGGFTALLFAAQQGDMASTRTLLDAGADINFATEEEGSALVIASAAGHEELAKFLLQRGADPDIKDAYGLTPLHFAVHRGVLIMNNWAPSETDKYGWERTNLPGLAKDLLAHGAAVDPKVEYAWPFLDNPFLSRAVEDPAQIEIVGSTPLLLAAASGDIDLMKLFIAHGADKQAKTYGGATLFMLAAGAGSERGIRDEASAIEAAKYVLSLGDVDVNWQLTENDAKNGPGAGKIDGRNIMHFAVTLGWSDMIHFLADLGVNLDHTDRYGMTPLMIAMGDPEARYYRNIPVGRYDDRYRRPGPDKKIEELLLEIGASPFTGTFIDKGSVN